MVLFGGLCAAIYVLFALAPVTYQSLLVANLLLGTAFLSAQNGLTSALGQQHVMSGDVSNGSRAAVVARLMVRPVLPSAPEMPCALSQSRLVPTRDIVPLRGRRMTRRT
jgi:hypothetical protein